MSNCMAWIVSIVGGIIVGLPLALVLGRLATGEWPWQCWRGRQE